MSTQTTNYGMTKPAATEYYDVAIQNANMDIIDEEMKANADAIAETVSDISAFNTSLSAEITARTNADSTLQTNINNEATARTNADALKANIASPNLTGTPTIATNIIYHAGNITVSTVAPSSALAEGCQHQVY